LQKVNGTARFLAFLIIVEGTTEKVLQFIMPLELLYNKNLGFIEQKNIFEEYTEIQTKKCLLIDIFLSHKNYF